MMMENVVGRLLVVNKSYRWDLHWVERLNSELLVWVTVMSSELGGSQRVLREDLRPLENIGVREKGGVKSGPAMFCLRNLRLTSEDFRVRAQRVREGRSLLGETLTTTGKS